MKSTTRLSAVLLAVLLCSPIKAQTEVMAWSNITGIRVEGQLMEFETSIRAVGKGWTKQDATGKERHVTKYDREGNLQIVTSSIAHCGFTQTVKENGKGSAVISLVVTPERDTVLEGLFFCVELPGRYFKSSKMTLKKSGVVVSTLTASDIKPQKNNIPMLVKANEIIAESPLRNFKITFDDELNVYLKNSDTSAEIYIPVTGSRISRRQELGVTFTINTGGKIDDAPVEIIVNPRNPGARFDGFGGNFRLQNPQLDPEVIQYCLDNMRVAWGRVEMPWQLWHPEENTDPIKAAEGGNLHEHVRQSMEMARKLTQIGMPVIISDWAAPAWAILGDPQDAFVNRPKGVFGYQLNPEKLQQVYKSLADYLVYLKQHYGVEPALFSFNESDLGINVRHTGKEHAEFIKAIGSYFASRGIATKLLLGDNSDATTFDFILPAMEDASTHKYIGAVSFHSWRGCDDATLQKWAGAARKMNLPLIIAEGSTDAAAWNYPEIFSEQSFALNEINLYMRLCSFCQPLSILQWQLTSDYSPLTGNGIFGTTGPLKPTRRFWNLRQLASTPAGSFFLPFTCNNEFVNCAAFGNIASGQYALHLVNNGASRKALIKGFPADIKSLDIYVTDEKNGMTKTGSIPVTEGTAELVIPPAAFITLTNNK
ncbi:MAG TPA: hypothetical protein VHI78_04595 [Bacteroidales bacterium]|jgi:hypothetical protein|nr:hypothetical protein [Bacteroidales bacterium]